MQSSMNPFAAAPARDPYYDAHLADRERSMLERERRLSKFHPFFRSESVFLLVFELRNPISVDQNYGGHQQQQQPQHPYSQPYGDREFRTWVFSNSLQNCLKIPELSTITQPHAARRPYSPGPSSPPIRPMDRTWFFLTSRQYNPKITEHESLQKSTAAARVRSTLLSDNVVWSVSS